MNMCEAWSGFDWCIRRRRSIGSNPATFEVSVELWRTDGRRTKVEVQQQTHAPSARRSFSTSVASNCKHQFWIGETLPTRKSPINTTSSMPLPSNMGQYHPERPEKTHDPSLRRTFWMPLRSSRGRQRCCRNDGRISRPHGTIQLVLDNKSAIQVRTMSVCSLQLGGSVIMRDSIF